MNSSFQNTTNLNESQALQSNNSCNGIPDKSQKYVQVTHASRLLNLNTFVNIDSSYDKDSISRASSVNLINSVTSNNSAVVGVGSSRQGINVANVVLPKVNIENVENFRECTHAFNLTPNFVK